MSRSFSSVVDRHRSVVCGTLLITAGSVLGCGREPCPEGVQGPTVRLDAALETCNARPAAFIDTPKIVPKGTVVTLDGTKSVDLNEDPLTFAWSLEAKPSASAAVIADEKSAEATFEADEVGSYTVTLRVTDGELEGATTLQISAINRRPVAASATEIVVLPGATVFLDGTQSSDPDGDPITFQWAFSSTPGGSVATLDDPTSATPSFLPDFEGIYVLTLVVSDADDDSEPLEVRVAVGYPGGPPIADAGPDLRARPRAQVTVDGSGSSDPDNDPLRFTWVIISKPTTSSTTLTSSVGAIAVFTPDKNGTYELELTVQDQFYTSSDRVLIEASGPFEAADCRGMGDRALLLRSELPTRIFEGYYEFYNEPSLPIEEKFAWIDYLDQPNSVTTSTPSRAAIILMANSPPLPANLAELAGSYEVRIGTPGWATPLALGTYPMSEYLYETVTANPGFSLRRSPIDCRTSGLEGSFTIHELAVAEVQMSGLHKFDTLLVTFEQRCLDEAGWIFGCLWYRSTLLYPP